MQQAGEPTLAHSCNQCRRDRHSQNTEDRRDIYREHLQTQAFQEEERRVEEEEVEAQIRNSILFDAEIAAEVGDALREEQARVDSFEHLHKEATQDFTPPSLEERTRSESMGKRKIA